MVQEERQSMARAAWLLVLATALLFLPTMITREVRSGEALYATVADEMVQSGSLWRTTVHGEPVQAYPAYAWLVAAGRVCGLPKTLALRLPALLCLAGLATLCGVVGRRRGGALAGLIAAALVLCNPAALRTANRLPGEALLALLLCAAWVTWYSVGQRRKHWTLAWLGALLFVVPAAFTAGARAVAIFYLPFVFLRRPVKGRRRLLLPSHLVVLALGVAVLAFWLRHVPDQIFLPWNELNTMPKVTLSYPVETILFPIKSLLYLMPWPFLIWPAFCMAYRPLEKNPGAFHYLRTIVVSAFVAAWLMPKMSPLVLMPILGPLAIMTGLHSELLIRRHDRHLRHLSLAMLLVGVVVAAFGLALAGLHLAGVIRFEGLGLGQTTWVAAILGVLLVAGVLAWRGPLRLLPVYTHLIVSFVVLASSFLALQTTWYGWSGNEMQTAGLVLAARLPPPDYLVVKPPATTDTAAASPAPATPGTDLPAPAAATPVPAAAGLGTAVVYRPLAESVVYRQTRNYHLITCFYLDRPVVLVQDPKDPKAQIPLPVPGPRQVLGETPPEAAGGAGLSGGPAEPVFRDAVYALCDNGPPVVPEVEWSPLTPPLDLRRRKAVYCQWLPGGHTVLRVFTEAAPVAADYQPEAVRLYRGVRR